VGLELPGRGQRTRGGPRTFCLYGGENSDAFAAHRLKVRLALSGKNTRLRPEALAESLYTAVCVDSIAGGVVQNLEGSGTSLPGASHGVELESSFASLSDQWPSGGAMWSLRTRLPVTVARQESAVLTLDDVQLTLLATWGTPMPVLELTEGGRSLRPLARRTKYFSGRIAPTRSRAARIFRAPSRASRRATLRPAGSAW
jgi:hypothetical protein